MGKLIDACQNVFELNNLGKSNRKTEVLNFSHQFSNELSFLKLNSYFV